MKLQFKYQKFQADAAKAVVDVFKGQPYSTPIYMIDRGDDNSNLSVLDTGWNNQKIVPELNNSIILKNIQDIQKNNNIKPSEKLEGKYNLTIEMETGVGKTYTYIKTMYELNKHYGWSKFIIVVPSIAIREGVYKTFQITQEHFAEEYGKKIRFFIYNSSRLTEIDRFAADSSINAMIINSQAFNNGKNKNTKRKTKGKGKKKSNSEKEASQRIYMKIDDFKSRRPIDVIAKTNPILIIDEPQSVEGKETKENLKDFNPLFTLRYSATHKKDSVYNMVYRLDAVDAYNKQLVKKISVKGITATGSTATESYVYLKGINRSKKADPTATIRFDAKGAKGVRKVTRKVSIGDNLYDYSGQLGEYKDGFVVNSINGWDSSIEFINGIKLYAGDVLGVVDENQLRRIQIRETILSHIERERQLFYEGIKVLSLFFIDEVAKYKQYDETGQAFNGIYADMFEEEYNDVISNFPFRDEDEDYIKYLNELSASNTHAGYFSIDKKGKMINTEANKNNKESRAAEISAYDLIMKNKELLLDRDPKKSPVRFIFSHSALREGWDNPNVFQICTLKESSAEIRKRQEVGRGLRLCVNQDGKRMDASVLGGDVHNINVLTVIASESYDDFASALQEEIAEAIDRPRAVTEDLFINRVIKDNQGNEQTIDKDLAHSIYFNLISNGYINEKGALTDKYYDDKAKNEVKVAKEVENEAESIIEILDLIYDSRKMQPDNGNKPDVTLKVSDDKLEMAEFKELWDRINAKSAYVVDFDTDELIKNSIKSINKDLHISKFDFVVESGSMAEIKSKDELEEGMAFNKEHSKNYAITASAKNVKYDLVGKIVEETGLTRKDVVSILTQIDEEVFNQFKRNPEEFIIKAAALINDEKATAIIEHIKYNKLDESYDTDIFTKSAINGKLDVNAMEVNKHLYDYLVYDSINEKNFALDLDRADDVAVYVKLPNKFYISTPVGKYNPDWAIAFYEDNIKHIYFVAETKGSMSSMELRGIETSKIHCAKEHFKAISGDNVKYDVVDSYKALRDLVSK